MPPVTNEKDEDQDELKDVEVVVEEDKPKQEEPAPKHEAEPKKDDEERRGKAKDRTDEDDERDELETAKDDAEREKIRARRREERKLRKERQEAEARELRELRDKVRNLEQRSEELDRTAKTTQYERVEQGINDAAEKMRLAKAAMEAAAKEGDWARHTEALEAYNSWRSRGEYLVGIKNEIVSTEQQRRSAPRVDPNVVRHAKEWMSRNEWYDPGANDPDSRTAFRIDAAMAAQGFDPGTPEYWKEFDKRLAKALPHRVKLKDQAEEVDDERDDRASQTTGSGRERVASGKTVFKLSAERVAAMKEAGIWDDEKARARAIKRYMDYDRQIQQGSRK